VIKQRAPHISCLGKVSPPAACRGEVHASNEGIPFIPLYMSKNASEITANSKEYALLKL
jgi:hypothetical protein